MRLYIIRHAHVAYRRGVALASVPPAERRLLSDPALSAWGQEQAALLAEHLGKRPEPADQQPLHGERPGFAIARLFCSPMRRALQTAQPVAAALGLRPEIWLDLHEMGGIRYDEGDGRGAQGFPGLSRAEVEEQFPGYVIPAGIADDGWWNRPPEQEAAFLSRVARVAEQLRSMAQRTHEDIAVITHGTAANYLLHALLGSEGQDAFYFNHYNTGITNLVFLAEETFLRYQNRLEHLPDAMLVT